MIGTPGVGRRGLVALCAALGLVACAQKAEAPSPEKVEAAPTPEAPTPEKAPPEASPPTPSPDLPQRRPHPELDAAWDHTESKRDSCDSEGVANPFAKLDYEHVYATAHTGYRKGGYAVSIDRSTGEYAPWATEKMRVELDADQIRRLTKLATAKSSYADGQPSCTIPRHTFTFEREGEIIAFLDLCFECASLFAVPFVPASKHGQSAPARPGEEPMCFEFNGLSDRGLDGFAGLANDLGLPDVPANPSDRG